MNKEERINQVNEVLEGLELDPNEMDMEDAMLLLGGSGKAVEILSGLGLLGKITDASDILDLLRGEGEYEGIKFKLADDGMTFELAGPSFQDILAGIMSGEMNPKDAMSGENIRAILDEAEDVFGGKASELIEKVFSEKIVPGSLLIMAAAQYPDKKGEIPRMIKALVDDVYDSTVGEYSPYLRLLLSIVAEKTSGEVGGAIGSILAGIVEGNTESFIPLGVAAVEASNALQENEDYFAALKKKAELLARKRKMMFDAYTDSNIGGFTREEAMTFVLDDTAKPNRNVRSFLPKAVTLDPAKAVKRGRGKKDN